MAEDKPLAAYDPWKACSTFNFVDLMWAPGVTWGNMKEYLDGWDVEDGAETIGGVHKVLWDIQQVSQYL